MWKGISALLALLLVVILVAYPRIAQDAHSNYQRAHTWVQENVPRQERYNTSSDFGEFREERRDGYDQGYEYRPPVRQPSYSPPQVERSKQKAPAPIVPGRGVPQQFQQNDAEDAWIISTLSSMFHAEVVRRERGEYSVRPKSVPYDVGSREFQQGLRALDARGYELSLTDEQGPYGGVGSHNKVAYITRTRK